jgi:Rad3-related DNA helicase
VTTDAPLVPASLIARAKKRRVTRVGDGSWIVHGEEKLNDQYDDYEVKADDGVARLCSCWTHAKGEYRARRKCSHALAVELAIAGEHEYADKRMPPGWEEEAPEDAFEFVPNDSQISEISKSTTVERKEDAGQPGEGEAAVPAPSPIPTPSPDPTVLDFDDLDWETIPHPGSIDTDPIEPPMPEQYEAFRDHQWPAICETVEHLRDGVKVVFVSAATGAGKTMIAESVRRLMGVKGIYTCTTKTLQDQILRDFGEYARTIKGRANYQTLERPDLTTDDCTMARKRLPACVGCPTWGKGSSFGTGAMGDDEEEASVKHCSWCHPFANCPYQVAKTQAWDSRLAVLNLAYFLSETAGFGSMFRGWPLVLLDEADQLERQLMSHVSVEIRPSRRKELGIGLPKKTVEDDWVRWIEEEVIPATQAKLRSFGGQQSFGYGDEEVKVNRRKKQLRAFLTKMKYLIEPIEREVDGEVEMVPRVTANWVLDGVEKPHWMKDWDESKVVATFKPVYVTEEAREVLWDRGGQFVLFSATFVSVSHTAKMLGLEDHEWAHVEVDYSFPVTQRPIIPRTVASVTYKTKKEAYPKLADEVGQIMEEHRGERILVHTVSYDLTKAVLSGLNRDGLGSRVMTYFNAGERTAAIAKYERTEDAVILAPSLDRGVDFKDDLCRVIVVCKIPYPFQDKQVKARLHGGGREGQTWYSIESIRTLCQMTGRGMRSEDDWCVTYVLDSQFQKLWQKEKRLFPSWWSEAVVWDENDPKWRGAVVVGRNR